MSSSNFVGSIPENYDKGLGPHIFAPYADDLAARVATRKPGSVLELAAGTGIVTRRIRDLLRPDCHLVASDLNQPMLEVARGKFDPSERVTFEQADATDLRYGDATFDVVVCQFGVMFFPDKDKSYAEARRVLRSGGTYIFNVWDSWADNPFAQITHETCARYFPDDPPGFYRVPFSYHDQDEIGNALSAAGFGEIIIAELPRTSAISSADLFGRGLIFGNPIFEELSARGADVDAVHRAVSSAISDELGDEMPLRAVVFCARVP
ncbi:MAG: class I SAM-dependent methyltransferase [Gammaproteobacteria bacterium]